MLSLMWFIVFIACIMLLPILVTISGKTLKLLVLVLFFFFFQAEDGIRYSSVTGVQTCALPIFRDLGSRAGDAPSRPEPESVPVAEPVPVPAGASPAREPRSRTPRRRRGRGGRDRKSGG